MTAPGADSPAESALPREAHSIALVAVAAGVLIQGDFAGEGAVDKREVTGGKNHAGDPPDKPNPQAVVSGFGVAHRQRVRSEEHTSELQSRLHLVCRLLLEKKKHREPSYTRHTTTPRP